MNFPVSHWGGEPHVPTTKTIFITTTGASSWTVPADWNSTDNVIHVIGAGGGGSVVPSAGRGGGGGGGYSSITNFAAPPGASVSVTVGAGGGSDLDGGDSFFNGASLAAVRTDISPSF